MHGITPHTTAVFKIGHAKFPLSTRVSSVPVTEPNENAWRNAAVESKPIFILFSIARHQIVTLLAKRQTYSRT